MPRKNRPLDRTTGALRDTSIVVIACEDMHAVKQYFAKFRAKRTQFKVLPTEEGQSSPRGVIDRLHDYRREYAQEEGDELWICIDADHWIRGSHQRELSQVLQECRQNEYGVAISNPCFEVWLLLHFTELSDALLLKLLGKEGSQSLQSGELNSLKCAQFENELRLVAGSYNKARVSSLDISKAQVQQAIIRASRSNETTEIVPPCPGTRVHKLLESLLSRDSLDLEE